MRINDAGYGQEQSDGVNGQLVADEITNWTENQELAESVYCRRSDGTLAHQLRIQHMFRFSNDNRNFLKTLTISFLTF
jgi:hypothetical protein